MNNLVIGLKRFFTNKNVVTIILVIVILAILYFGYSGSIKSKTNPVTIPVAARRINPQTKITKDDIKYIQVASSMVNKDVIRSSALILDKYTNINVTIPEGSMFYSEWLAKAEDVPGNWIEQLDRERGELGYYMSVDTTTTLGNSVLPGSYIDFYMMIEDKDKDDNEVYMFGKLMKDVKVLVVHDSSGKNIFRDSSNIGSPSKIGFAVDPDTYALLHKAEYLNINLILAPRGSEVPNENCQENCVVVTESVLRDYIDAQVITVEDKFADEELDNILDELELME